MGSHIRRLGAAALIGGSLWSSPIDAQQPVANFYAGKTIKFLIGFAPGGGADAYARLVARFLRNHIPGDPIIVPEYMPGGGGRIVGRYVYRAAPKDGSVIAMADQSLVFQQALGDRSLQFDVEKFNWIGNVDADNNVLFTWYKSGVKNLADVQKVSVTLAATSANTTSEAYPKVLNAMLGTKFKIVRGYTGGNTAHLAMENGEVAGRGASSWANFKVSKPDWVRDDKINVLVQVGL
jgi:tripartite-type tricarboxylate transporter receptor subunit TctC